MIECAMAVRDPRSAAIFAAGWGLYVFIKAVKIDTFSRLEVGWDIFS